MSDDNGYIFVATGDSCEVCQALDGMRCEALPHANCQCSIVPIEEGYECETQMEFFGPDEVEPGKFALGAEISVTCPHGTEMGTTVQYIMDASDDDPMGFADACSAAADELCGECPRPKEPFNCC